MPKKRPISALQAGDQNVAITKKPCKNGTQTNDSTNDLPVKREPSPILGTNEDETPTATKPPPKKKPTRKKRTHPGLGAFNRVPTEILEQIAGEIKFVRDKMAFADCCKTFQKVLGKKNRHFWFTVGKERNAVGDKYETFDPGFEYLKDIRKMCGLGRRLRKYCHLCFAQGSKHYLLADVRCCTECAKANLLKVMHIRCIPGLDTQSVKMVDFTGNWRMENALDINRWEYWGRNEFCWKPDVERKMARLYPGKSFEVVLRSTKAGRVAYEKKCITFFEENFKGITKKITDEAFAIMEPLIEKYVDLRDTQEKKQGKRRRRSQDRTAEEIVEYLKGWPVKNYAEDRYRRYMNHIRQFGLELEVPTDEEITKYAKDIAFHVVFKGSWL